jgi:hypothetical protein
LRENGPRKLDTGFAAAGERLCTPQRGEIRSVGDRRGEQASIAVNLHERGADVCDPPQSVKRDVSVVTNDDESFQAACHAMQASCPAIGELTVAN